MLSRRSFLITGTLAIAGSGVSLYAAQPEQFDGHALTVQQAYKAANSGQITLIDIRRPDEWRKTGVGEPAYPIDMRRKDFVDALDAIVNGVRDVPVALICARGVRSARLSNQLTQAGFTNIIDVPEGMLGSKAGPGWLRANLPLKHQ